MRAGQFNFNTGTWITPPAQAVAQFNRTPLAVWLGPNVRKYPRPMTFLPPGNVPVTVAPAGNTAQ